MKLREGHPAKGENMPTLRTLFATIALTLLLTVSVSPFVPVQAADLRAGGAEATQYQFADKTRRGVLVRGGVLLIRADGCFFSNAVLTNGNPYPVTVTISYSWPGRYGRPLVSLPGLHTTTLAPGTFLAVEDDGCGAGVGGYYPTISRSSPARIISVR